MASTRHTEQQWSATAGELRYRGIRPGSAVLHVATGGAIGIAAFVALTSLLSLTLGLLPTVVGAAISGALLLGVNSALSAVHRSRMRSFLGLHITAPAPMSGDRLASRLRRVLTTAPLWKSLAYNAIVGLLLFVLGVVVVASLATGLVCVTAPIFGTPVTLGFWGCRRSPRSPSSPFSSSGRLSSSPCRRWPGPWPTAMPGSPSPSWAGPGRRSSSKGSSIWPRPAPGRSTRPTLNDAGSNGTCMTGPNNASRPWPCTSASPGPRCRPVPGRPGSAGSGPCRGQGGPRRVARDRPRTAPGRVGRPGVGRRVDRAGRPITDPRVPRCPSPPTVAEAG